MCQIMGLWWASASCPSHHSPGSDSSRAKDTADPGELNPRARWERPSSLSGPQCPFLVCAQCLDCVGWHGGWPAKRPVPHGGALPKGAPRSAAESEEMTSGSPHRTVCWRGRWPPCQQDLTQQMPALTTGFRYSIPETTTNHP